MSKDCTLVLSILYNARVCSQDVLLHPSPLQTPQDPNPNPNAATSRTAAPKDFAWRDELRRSDDPKNGNHRHFGTKGWNPKKRKQSTVVATVGLKDDIENH